jgi:hypothetical protein
LERLAGFVVETQEWAEEKEARGDVGGQVMVDIVGVIYKCRAIGLVDKSFDAVAADSSCGARSCGAAIIYHRYILFII